MKLEDLIDIAQKWNALGWAVQEQAEAVLIDGEPTEDQNENALEMVAEWLDYVERVGGVDSSDIGTALDTLRLKRPTVSP